MLWLCAYFPELSLEVYSRGVRDTVPLVIRDTDPRKPRVIAGNSSAWQAGIRIGMRVSAARSLIQNLRVHARNVAAEHDALLQLAAWAGQFSSLIHVAAPQILLLEIQGSLKLFGGLPALRGQIEVGIQALGYQAWIAVAPTPLAAQWLAASEQSVEVMDRSGLVAMLAGVPLDILDVSERDLKTLHGMGLSCVGECLRLPRDGLAQRLGPGFVLALDRAMGRVADPRRIYIAPARFDGRLLLPVAVHSSEALLFAVRRMLLELCGVLCAHQGSVQDLELCWLHDNDTETVIHLGLLTPGHDAKRLATLLRERLQNMRLSAPVVEIRLTVERFLPRITTTVDWVADSNGDYQEWPMLLERLRVRLGEQAVQGLDLLDAHRPECAWRYCTPDITVSGANKNMEPAPQNSYGALRRPLWLLPQPKLLKTCFGRPWFDGELTAETPRERIVSGWWDDKPVCRDYYRMRNPEHARFWVFRELSGSGSWFLHGIFA